MTITLRVNHSHTCVDGNLHTDIYKEFKNALGYKDPQATWTARSKHWDGMKTTVCFSRYYCKCPIKKDGVHFPTGLLSKAREFFSFKNMEVNVIDERNKPTEKKKWAFTDKIVPYDYQDDTIKKSVKQGRGLIKLATGGGKTLIGSGIIAELGCSPFIFYVTSLDLLKQAKNEIERFVTDNGVSMKVGQVGGGKKDIQDITVMTVQTAVKSLGAEYVGYGDDDENEWLQVEDTEPSADVADLIHSCRGMIADEVHHWASESCQIISDHSVNCRYKFGLSATPFRDMGDDLLIDACFGKTIVDINASFLIKRKILVRPDIYFVNMPKRSFDGSYQTVYKEAIVENDERNAIIGNVAQKLVSTGRQVLVLVKHIPHGERCESVIPGSFFLHGSHSSKERENHLSLMRERKAPVTIATSIFDEGVDVKPLNALILAGSGKSQTRALQRVGRVIRTFEDPSTGYIKNDAVVVDFKDNYRYMNGHSNKRRQIYLTEPEFVIKDIYPNG